MLHLELGISQIESSYYINNTKAHKNRVGYEYRAYPGAAVKDNSENGWLVGPMIPNP
jgi:hypothetical protein